MVKKIIETYIKAVVTVNPAIIITIGAARKKTTQCMKQKSHKPSGFAKFGFVLAKSYSQLEYP